MTKSESSASSALPDADQQAANFKRVREAHQSEVAEDYVELIADLINTTGEARAVDIARRLGVAHATAVKTIARLQREGLVSSQPYRAVFLTEKGRELAVHSKRRHEIVVDFLRAIGISEKTAQRDAEGIEHHVSEETLAAFERVIRAESLAKKPRPTLADSAKEK
ncbi:iron (metal) dependent repressor, DtxR family [Modicisalibacter muralis]|uniref:Transcriptional regulator MntR n=1 Tax=Modicisalibacter muralis TaxID=119000 RepID=A0A1G9KCI6_9GAMM|nr:manganese-binding transcriptional regulator MntR [Halomonas muralis]SDL47538.1 iron (metal) dependent repressor, DtxR family [Halomonas muralis]